MRNKGRRADRCVQRGGQGDRTPPHTRSAPGRLRRNRLECRKHRSSQAPSMDFRQAEGRDSARQRARRCQPERFAEHQGGHRLPGGPHGHPDADFFSPLGNGVGDDAVDAGERGSGPIPMRGTHPVEDAEAVRVLSDPRLDLELVNLRTALASMAEASILRRSASASPRGRRNSWLPVARAETGV